MSQISEITSGIQNAYAALCQAIDAIDAAENKGLKVHASISNRLITAQQIVREVSKEFSIVVDLNTPVRDFYVYKFPNDELGPDLRPDTTFADLVRCLNNGQDVYNALGQCADTVIREQVFSKLSKLLDVDYRTVYKKWLDPGSHPALEMPKQREATDHKPSIGNNTVSCIRKGQTDIIEVSPESIREGDTFFVNQKPVLAGSDMHLSGDASYDGYLVFDTSGSGWFPEELSSDLSASKEPVPKRSLADQIQSASKSAASTPIETGRETSHDR